MTNTKNPSAAASGLTTTTMLAAALTLSSCTPYAAFKPATTPAPQDAFAKTTRALIERGETIETKDEAAGLIVTKWEESTSMGTVTRLRWNITITNATITVDSQCQLRMKDQTLGDDGQWKPCDTQPGDRGEKAKAIAGAVK